jgi:hypothetical protein
MDTGTIPSRWVWTWLAGMILLTLAALLLYGVAQQAARRTVEDAPRALVARSRAALVSGQEPQVVTSGPTVNLAVDASPFVVVYDAQHHVVATDAVLAGAAPVVPAGVLDTAGERGEDAVTWQPSDGVREAVVAQPWRSATGEGVVVAGASLAPSEDRTAVVRNVVATAWALGSLLLTGALVQLRRVLTR